MTNSLFLRENGNILKMLLPTCRSYSRRQKMTETFFMSRVSFFSTMKKYISPRNLNPGFGVDILHRDLLGIEALITRFEQRG